ncbi:iron(III) transport system substrate-binding protein [Noviherbaspirillum humi]|uniref:Iron(III) transport system substrate-binding protein n=1 Tax=Noviherbaspirillum humi TaxID=1688639 RepID=A0A239IK27_9BURK|nr:extracellular solute-binding protein [Noviherbaspirillum humi]SNS94106.1 iron(III) transport system substrate-binding protein [Noviherbaspirillum humi]
MKSIALSAWHCALAACAIGFIAVSGNAAAQARNPPASIYTYQGEDREQRLLDGARKEGTVAVYTSLNVKDSAPIVEAFEKKYAAQKIKVTLWRASGEKVVQRALTEARAGRFTPDVFESDGIEMEILAREKLMQEFYSPAFKTLPPQAFPAHRQYVADRFNFFTIAYNTKLVKPEDVPNNYQDLLDPKWAGKIALEAGDADWFMALAKSMGEKEGMAYFRKLADMKPQIRTGHTLVSELVAAGEIPLAAAVYNHAVERLAKNGAPIKWKALAPTMGRPGAVGVARHAPHPHAALLFADFLLSPEGQELIKQRNRVPASTQVESPLNQFKYETINPAQVLDEADKWETLWNNLFLKNAGASKQ